MDIKSNELNNKTEDLNELWIVIYGYDVDNIERSIKILISEITNSKVKFRGPIPLKTKKKSYVLLASPHKHGASKRAFHKEEHRRLIILELNNNPYSKRIVSNLQHIKIPNTVKIVLKVK